MTPLEFEGHNLIYAKDQSEYIQLPAHRTPEGEVTVCWGLTWAERWRVFRTGTVWFTSLTFNRPLQPQRPSTIRPEMD